MFEKIQIYAKLQIFIVIHHNHSRKIQSSSKICGNTYCISVDYGTDLHSKPLEFDGVKYECLFVSFVKRLVQI